MRMLVTLTVSVVALQPWIVTAQQSAIDLTGRPTWEARHPFTRIVGVGVLAGNQVVVADAGVNELHLIGRNGTLVRPIGRSGRGPGEYQRPIGVHRGAAGTLLVPDAGLNVVHVIDANGQLTRYLHLPELMRRRVSQARGVDSLGRIYLHGAAYARGVGIFDSVAVLRWDPPRNRLDTLAKVRSGVSGSVDGGSVSLESKPLAWADEWTVTPAGDVVVARTEPYRIDRLQGRGGGVIAGQPISSERRPVTAAVRRAYRDRMRGSAPPGVSMSGGQGSGAAPQGATWVGIPDGDFPEVMPPFHGRNALVVAEGGHVWIDRTMPGDSRAVWDVVAPSGVRVRQAHLPLGTRVAHVTEGGVFLVREDPETGEQFLGYHALR